MRDVGVDLNHLISSSHGVRPLVSAWLGETLLAADVPILAGTLSTTGDSQVPEQLSLSVPAVRGGVSWLPRRATDPLAAYGQRLSVSYVLSRSGGSDVAVPLGWFAIQSWDENEDGTTIEVEALGLLQVVADARLLAPTSPAASVTLASEFARIMGGLLPYEIDAALVDRTCPRSFVWDEDRLSALYDIADAWPAQLRVDSDGVCRLTPDLPATPGTAVVTWRDGERNYSRGYTLDSFEDPFIDIFGTLAATFETVESGTVISAPRGGSRDEVYNAVVVRAENTDDANRPPVQGFAYDSNASSPTYWSGNYGQVPRFAASPLVTTNAQANAMAAKMLRSALRPTRTRVVSAVPDPRVELDDVASLTWDGETVKGYVSSISLSLTADGGQATYIVEVP